MRIAIVTTWFERGAAHVSRLFMESLQRAGDSVFIYARGGERYAKKNPVWDRENVVWAPEYHSSWEPTYINRRHFVSFLKKHRIEAVIFNEQSFMQPVLWCSERGIKTIGYVDYYKRNTIPLFAAYDALICNTRRHYSAFSWHPEARYVAWGADCERYRPAKKDAADSDNVVFFHSAGMAPARKGTDILLRAFENVRAPGKLLIHTQISLEKEFPPLKDLIAKLTAEKKLEIVERTIPAPGLYFRGDVYVYPARLDGIGLTVAEAMASGLPAVVTDSAPMSEFIEPKTCRSIPVERFYAREDGYYWPMCDANTEKLSEILNDYVEHADVLPELKSSVRDFAVRNLNWRQSEKEFVAAVHECRKGEISRDVKERIIRSENRGIRKIRSCIMLFFRLKGCFNA
ncbi:MAG: glycosyltransferase family 4 protein [Victivallaceae bacterium]|nr:glycosyltransferase family 4 protein [Victivallaceae bacterium]